MRYRVSTLVIPLLALSVFATVVRGEDRAVGYSLDVRIDPAAGRLHASGEVRIERSELDRDHLVFILHETFDIESLSINGAKAQFTFEPWGGEPNRTAGRRVVVALPQRVRGAYLRMEIAYGGTLLRLPQFGSAEGVEGGRALDDAINGRRVELAWYSSWYPQLGDFGGRFETVISAELPEGWTVVSNGIPSIEGERGSDSRPVWSSRSSNDILVIAAPDLRRRLLDRSGVAVEIYDTALPEPIPRPRGRQRLEDARALR